MPIKYRVEEMEYLHSTFYLWMIYGGEGVDRLVSPQELGNGSLSSETKLVRYTC